MPHPRPWCSAGFVACVLSCLLWAPEAQAGPAPQDASASEPSPDAQPDSGSESEPGTESEPEPGTEPEPEPEPGTESEPGTEAEPGTESDAVPEAGGSETESAGAEDGQEPAGSGEEVEAEAESEEFDGYSSSVIHDPPERKLPPRHKLVYKNLFALRYNPLGLVNQLTLGWRMQLFMKPGALYEDSYFGIKAHTFVNPAFARIGPRIEIQPLAILNLAATYSYVGYFTTFDQVMSFPTPTAPWDDDTLAARGDAGENYATGGHLIELAALLQAKVGPIAARSNLKTYYAAIDLRDGDTVYYDQTLDILHVNQGWTLVNDADILYLFDFGLKVAARHTVTHAFYQQKHFLPGEPVSRPNSPTHRVGPAFLYTFYDRPDRRFNRPTVFLLAQWWVRHRYRTGANVSAGVPYLAVGLLFDGELLPDPRSKEAKEKRRRRKRR